MSEGEKVVRHRVQEDTAELFVAVRRLDSSQGDLLLRMLNSYCGEVGNRLRCRF
jgi:hypothetical protein